MQTRTSRRRAALAALAISATLLAACGSTSDTGSTATPAKIRVTGAAGGAGTRTAAAATAGGADEKMAADAAMPAIAMAPVEYVVEGTLPALDGEAAAWHLPAESGVTTKDVAALAKQLGVEGDVREVPADEGGGWRVGSTDYTGPWVMVDPTGAATWFYDSAAYASVKVACAPVARPEPAAAPDGSATTDPSSPDAATSAPAEECPAPTPPADVPSNDEARAKAMALAKALGVEPRAEDVRVDGDEWGRYVTWSLRLGDIASPLQFSATYGGEGKLTSASGYLGTPQRAAEYPLVGSAAALEQLKTGAGSFWGAGPAVMTGDVAIATEGGSAASSGAGVAVGEPAPGGTTCDPATCTTAPAEAPTPITVTVSSVESALVMLWGADGDVWLVPGYRFSGPDGEVATIPAIDSSYIEQVQPAADSVDTIGGAARSGAAVAPAATPDAAVKP